MRAGHGGAAGLVLAAAVGTAGCNADEPAGAGSTEGGATAGGASTEGSGAPQPTGANDAGVTSGGNDSGPDGGGTTNGGGATDTGFPPPALDDCIDNGAAGEQQFVCGGLTFDVSVPAACLAAPCGLVVDVHGRTVNALIHDLNTNMRALGVARGYIVVQPNAPGGVPRTAWSESDDALVLDFVERTIATFHVDPARVHLTGFSQGGFMTWRMACARSDLFASVAPASACGGLKANADCTFQGADAPTAVVPILYTHGTTDALISFDCALPRRDAVVAHYGLGAAMSVSEDASHRWSRHTGPDGMVLEFLEHDYRAAAAALEGHCIVGGNDPGTQPGQLLPISCVEDAAFVWGEAVLDFFEAHPRP